jgi:carbon storage regulator
VVRPSDKVGNERGIAGRSTATVGESIGVLVLTRKPKERIMIGDDVEIILLSAAGGKVRIGIQAPTEVPVYRTEIYTEIRAERRDEAIGRTRAAPERSSA